MFELIKNEDTYLLRVRNAFELRSYSFLRGDKSKEAIEKVVLSAIA